ncbi:hypothetical protein CsSME_00042118 [Camellia sinensis var. sinensis]
MEAAIGKFFESVGNFFSGGDEIPWCDGDIVSKPHACLARTGLARAWLSYSYENKLEGMIIQKHQKCPKANKEKNLPGKVIDIESRLLHHLLDIKFLQDGLSNRMVVLALIAREVLDVVDSFWIGGWDDGLDGDGGGAEDAVLGGFGDGVLVLWVSIGSGDLPWLLHVTS